MQASERTKTTTQTKIDQKAQERKTVTKDYKVNPEDASYLKAAAAAFKAKAGAAAKTLVAQTTNRISERIEQGRKLENLRASGFNVEPQMAVKIRGKIYYFQLSPKRNAIFEAGVPKMVDEDGRTGFGYPASSPFQSALVPEGFEVFGKVHHDCDLEYVSKTRRRRKFAGHLFNFRGTHTNIMQLGDTAYEFCRMVGVVGRLDFNKATFYLCDWRVSQVEECSFHGSKWFVPADAGVPLKFFKSSLHGATFTNLFPVKLGDMRKTRFYDSSLQEAALTGLDFHSAVFDGSNPTGASLERASLLRCRMIGVEMNGVDLTGAVFSECDLTGATFRRCNLAQTSFRNCTLNGAQFRSCKSSNPTFIGCKASKSTKLPKGAIVKGSEGDNHDNA